MDVAKFRNLHSYVLYLRFLVHASPRVDRLLKP